jgi:hypothetical protein
MGKGTGGPWNDSSLDHGGKTAGSLEFWKCGSSIRIAAENRNYVLWKGKELAAK